MKPIRKDCGLSLEMMSGIVCGIEVIFSLIIVALVMAFWTIDNHPKMFYYQAHLNDTYIKRQKILEGCVISWSLSILLFLALWRMVSAPILLQGIKKHSPLMAQYWIMFKIIAVNLSIFIVVIAFTSPIVKPSGFLSLIVDLITSYFIVLLYPSCTGWKRGSQSQGNK